MGYQLIVFDWDGTLMDSEATIVATMQQAIADVGVEPRSNDQIRNIIGLGLKEAVEALLPASGGAEQGAVVERYRYHFLKQDISDVSLFDGVVPLLDQLTEAGYFLAIATGKGRRGLDKVLDALALRDYFHITRCADETRSKPHPQMLHEILDYVGVTPAQALMVGDSEYDMLLATNAGVDSAAVSYGVHEIERLQAHGPRICLDRIGDLWPWLHQQSMLARPGSIE